MSAVIESSEEPVLIRQIDGGTARLILNRPAQYNALSKSKFIKAGFVFGLYVPSFSINLPSRGALLSATTIAYCA